MTVLPKLTLLPGVGCAVVKSSGAGGPVLQGQPPACLHLTSQYTCPQTMQSARVAKIGWRRYPHSFLSCGGLGNLGLFKRPVGDGIPRGDGGSISSSSGVDCPVFAVGVCSSTAVTPCSHCCGVIVAARTEPADWCILLSSEVTRAVSTTWYPRLSSSDMLIPTWTNGSAVSATCRAAICSRCTVAVSSIDDGRNSTCRLDRVWSLSGLAWISSIA